MTAITTLCSIIAQRSKATKSFYYDQVGFDQLVSAGFVRVNGILQSIGCDACDDSHDAEVVFENKTYGHYCPDVGFVPLDHEKIQAVQPDIPQLIADLANTLDCKRRKSSPIHGDTWRIGALDTPAGSLVLYFYPTLSREQDVREVQAAIDYEVGAAFRLIFTAVGTLSAAGARSARLDDIVELVSPSGALASLADPRTIAGAPTAAKSGRPSPYADKLAYLILQRIEAGTALHGRNEEGRAIAKLYLAKYPNETAPSLPTINKHITDLRTGS